MKMGEIYDNSSVISLFCYDDNSAIAYDVNSVGNK
jgi:hypothetical protein